MGKFYVKKNSMKKDVYVWNIIKTKRKKLWFKIRWKHSISESKKLKNIDKEII